MKKFVVMASIVAFILTMVSLYGVWLQLEKDPIHIEPVVGSIDEFTITYGETFYFSRMVCSTKETIVEVDRDLINLNDPDVRLKLGTVRYVAYVDPTRQCYPINFTTSIPPKLNGVRPVPTGTYLYSPVMYYNINPVNRVIKPAPSIKLNIVDK